MTVKDLLELLSQEKPDAKVFVDNKSVKATKRTKDRLYLLSYIPDFEE